MCINESEKYYDVAISDVQSARITLNINAAAAFIPSIKFMITEGFSVAILLK